MDSTHNAIILQAIIPHFYRLLKNERSLFFRSHKITPTQYDVLAFLTNESLNLSALSELVGLDSSTLVGIVDRLEKIGLVKKRVSPRDRRKNIISITEKGSKTLAQVPEFVSPSLQRILKELNPDDQENLTRILRGIVGDLEEIDPSIMQRNDNVPLQPVSVL